MESEEVDEPIVSTVAVEAAWKAAQSLDAHEQGQARELLEGASGVVGELGHAELSRGSALLVAGLLGMLLPDDDSRRDDEGEDMVGVALKAITTRLRDGFPQVCHERLPLLVAVASAGLTGQNTVHWCDRLGAGDAEDALALTYLLWLMRDLVDSLYESPGTADELVTTALLTDQPS